MVRKMPNLVEVLVGCFVLGVVAVVTVPRFTSAATAGVVSDQHDALRQRLQVLRVAIERYYQDHGAYPGQLTDGLDVAGRPETVARQLTGRSDPNGRVVLPGAPGATVADGEMPRELFGPYLRDGLPPCPVPPNEGATALVVIRGAAPPTFVPDVPAGWVYNCDTGEIAVNSDATDAAGRPFITY